MAGLPLLLKAELLWAVPLLTADLGSAEGVLLHVSSHCRPCCRDSRNGCPGVTPTFELAPNPVHPHAAGPSE